MTPLHITPTGSRPPTPRTSTPTGTAPAGRSASAPASPVASRSPSPSTSRRPLGGTDATAVNTAQHALTEQLDHGGMALLTWAVARGLEFAPASIKPYADVGVRLGRTFGLLATPVAGPVPANFAELSTELDRSTAAIRSLVERTRPGLENTLAQDPARLATEIGRVAQDSDRISVALRQMPLPELRAHREAVKDQTWAWWGGLETLHAQVKASPAFGPDHPARAEALGAQMQASLDVVRTLVRMAVARMGAKAFDLAVGPVIGQVVRRFDLQPAEPGPAPGPTQPRS